MFFDGWHGVLRVLVVGTLAYFALVAWLRITGKRSVAKWNAFDLIVTVALGSTLATILLTSNVALVEGVVGMGLLLLLQFAISWVSVRSGFARRAVKNEPTLLMVDGAPCRDAMKRERVTEGELRAAIRQAGKASYADVQAVVLETDGSLSVVTSGLEGDRRAMEDVAGGDGAVHAMSTGDGAGSGDSTAKGPRDARQRRS